MDPLLISAASGVAARMESLDMLANNVANTGTVAFKADREFYGLYTRGLSGDLPLIEKQWTDFSQGQLLPTGDPLDLALEGEGFLALNASPDSVRGPASQAAAPVPVLYTRGGHFRISRANQLTTPEGHTLRDVHRQGLPITVNPELPIEIDGSGIVRQDSREIGQIELGGIPNPEQTLKKLGISYFSRGDTDVSAPGVPQNAFAAPAGGTLKQGVLEQSNVSPAGAAVRLVSVMRQFEMLQRALALGSEMNKRALDEVARISG